MKFVNLISLPVLFVSLVPSSFAGQILPTMYAREYCSMRELGVNKQEAIKAATEVAYVQSFPDSTTVTIDGVSYTADIVRAIRIVEERCPEYL